MDFLFFFVIKRLSMKSIHINKIIVILLFIIDIKDFRLTIFLLHYKDCCDFLI